MSTIVKTQGELDAALASDETYILIDSPRGVWLFLSASGSATVRAYGSATVRAYGSATVEASGSATVRAYGSATVRAYDSATVRAYGSATVEAYDSATVRAYDSATVRAYDSATVHGSKYVAIHLHSKRVQLDGAGVVIDVTDINLERTEDYLEYHGVEVNDGRAVLYKAVDDELNAGHGRILTAYPVGETVTATDWDPRHACGFGLHFSHRPAVAGGYLSSGAKGRRFLEVTVAVAELVALGDKVKAPSCVVVREVDINGDPIR